MIKRLVPFMFVFIMLASFLSVQSYAKLGVGNENGIEYYQDSTSVTDENGNIIGDDGEERSDTLIKIVIPSAAVLLVLFTGTGLFIHFRRKKKNVGKDKK